MLLAAPGVELDPHFGRDSARAHAGSGASALAGDWPRLRRDVDTSQDLVRATELGIGPHTRAVLANREVPRRSGHPHPDQRERGGHPHCPNL